MTEENNTDVAAQLKRIADHLGFLEKKLDTLLEQSQNRKPFNQGFGGDRPNRGYRPNRGPGYPSRHAGQSGYASSNRYQGNRGPRPEPNGNRTEHSPSGHYQKKYVPHRGTR